MYAVVTHVKLKEDGKRKIGEAVRRMELPEIRDIPGFIAYYVLNEKGEDYTTIAVFEDPSGYYRWKDMATKAHGQFAQHLLDAPGGGTSVTAGHVVFSRTAR